VHDLKTNVKMQTLVKISWRNIWRNRSRSLTIITAIVLGLMGGVFSAAMRLALEQQQFEDTVENQVSHIQIHHPGFIANPEARYRIENGRKIAEELNDRNDIVVASPRTVFDGMISTANMNAPVRIKGIDPVTEARTTSLDAIMVEGTYFEQNGRLPSIIIGEALAGDLNAGAGSRIVLTFQDTEGEVVSASFRVEGTYTVTSRSFEERTVFARAPVINDLIGAPEAVTEIAVVIEDPDDYRVVADELANLYPGTEVRHWADLEPSLYYSLEVLNEALIWILIIIIMAVSFGLLNTILMSILERVRELGVLMAIGMKKIRVFSMIVLETTMIAILGGITGLILSFAMVNILGRTGVPVPGGEGLKEFGYASVLYPRLETGFYFEIAVVLVIFAILAAIYPAWKAITLQPAEAVRQE
jgi:putative ABC transport system permease protein